MLGMILAAGEGRRLRPLTETVPKTLLPVHDTSTILDVVLRNFAEVGLRDVVLVVGYAAEAIEARRPDLERTHGVRLELVYNDRATKWNNCYSLWLARQYFGDGVLLSNGDTVHPRSVEDAMLASRGAAVSLAVDTVKSLGAEEMKLTLGGDERVARISKSLEPGQAYAEYIGVTVIEPTAAAPLADALEATWRRDPSLYYEDGFQELTDRAGDVRTVPIGAVDWVEVDDHDDLVRAREIACRY